jgi:hypothetical protein
MIKKSLLLGSAIALFACAAHADVLWSQPWDGGSSFFSSQNDTSGGNGNFATTYDDFTLAGAASVTGANFTGAFFNPATAAPISSFTVKIYQDNAGSIGSVLDSELVSFSQSSLGSPGGFPAFEYTVALTPLSLAAGTYWISFVPDLGFPPQWGTGTSSVGTNNAQQTFFGNTSSLNSNMAFDVLGGSGAPEPAAWALMLTGFGAAGVMLRRARRTALA